MKKIITFFVIFIIVVSCVMPVSAAESQVTYDGNAGNFIFEPGSEQSLTDLFPDFKDVMPGDSITQKITVRNNADNRVKIKIYLRSLGAQAESVDFLSQLHLCVKKSSDNEMAYMFDADADRTDGLSDWFCFGTLYSGGEVNLDVMLDVPASLDSQYRNEAGFLDWEFMIEEFPVEESDPKPPQTGDDADFLQWIPVAVVSFCILVLLIIWRKKENEKENKKEND